MTKIQEIVNHFLMSKGMTLDEIKEKAKKKEIIYARYTKPAKQLLELAGSVEKAKKAIDIVADWSKSIDRDYAIETVFKKWLELDTLKPKAKILHPFYRGDPMIKTQKGKWFVITPDGKWLEFADQEEKIEWK